MDSNILQLVEEYFKCKDRYFQARIKAFEYANERNSPCCSGCDDEYFEWVDAEEKLRGALQIHGAQLSDDEKNMVVNRM